MAKTPKRRGKKSPKRVTQLHSKTTLVRRSRKKTLFDRFLAQGKLEMLMQNRRELPLRPGQRVGFETLRTGLGKAVLYNVASRKKVLQVLESAGFQVRPQLICELEGFSKVEGPRESQFNNTGLYSKLQNNDVIKTFFKKTQFRNEENDSIAYTETYDPEELEALGKPKFKFHMLQNLSVFAKEKPFFFQCSIANMKYQMVEDQQKKHGRFMGSHVFGCVFLPKVDTIAVFNTYAFDPDMKKFLQHFFSKHATSVFLFPNHLETVFDVDAYEYNVQGICDATEPGSCQAYSFILPFKLAKAGILRRWNEQELEFQKTLETIKMVYDAMTLPKVSEFNDLRREVGLLGGKTTAKKRRKSPKKSR